MQDERQALEDKVNAAYRKTDRSYDSMKKIATRVLGEKWSWYISEKALGGFQCYVVGKVEGEE